MSKFFTPTLRIALGLVALTVSLVLFGFILGLVPDESRAEINARARIAEALAMQLAAAAARDDVITVQETLSFVERRNSSVLSLGLRRANGNLLFASRDHALHWVEPDDRKSTPLHVQVPLLAGDKAWGKVEISFVPLESGEFFAGIPTALAAFVGFLSLLGFAGYYVILRRALRELDPSRVIPDRVQVAFDSLAEGVMILDEKEMVLLANSAFAQAINETPQSLFGKNASDLKWRQWDNSNDVEDYPWRVAVRDGQSVTAVHMGLRTADDSIHSFKVNATCIMDAKGAVSGAIVTFDDITALERKNEDLVRTVRQLEETEEEINRRNQHLQYLASHDPLTGCLNRRAFFSKTEAIFERAHREDQHLACLMVDLDHFKSINDRFGHAIGDKVIVGIADILKASCRGDDLAGRYGGEEFCVVFTGSTADEVMERADRIRQDVINGSPAWLPGGETITASIGVAMRPIEYTPSTAMETVDRADKALYQAKENGRDQVIFWDETPLDANGPTSKHYPRRRSTQHVKKVRATEAPGDTTAAVIGSPVVQSNNHHELEWNPVDEPPVRLPAREVFMGRIVQSIARAERTQRKFAVLQISIDSFERISEVFGETGSQQMTNLVAARLLDVLRRSDTVSLVGQSENLLEVSRLAERKFAIELFDIDQTESVTWITKRITESLSSPITIENQMIYMTCSIGISVYPEDGTDAETLVRHAGIAERHAREDQSKDSYVFFTKAMNDSARRQLVTEAGIRTALENDGFALHYQPIIDLRSGKPVAVEALLRPTATDLKDTPLEYLISIAEQTGLMSEIGEWVLGTALDQMEQWLENGVDLPKISVNISATQLRNTDAIERLMDIVGEMKIAPEKLQVEITETAMMQDIEKASQTMRRLQQIGVQIALDDFGKGQSSLTYLRKFRPDVLKIDREFISKIDASRTDEKLVSAIVAMSHELGLRVVAEGVETADQLDRVRHLGCDEAQGYLISKPMPGIVMLDWLQLFATTGDSLTVIDEKSRDVA